MYVCVYVYICTHFMCLLCCREKGLEFLCDHSFPTNLYQDTMHRGLFVQISDQGEELVGLQSAD